jgi:hypothetical protein
MNFILLSLIGIREMQGAIYKIVKGMIKGGGNWRGDKRIILSFFGRGNIKKVMLYLRNI